jgi:hypothetical protein
MSLVGWLLRDEVSTAATAFSSVASTSSTVEETLLLGRSVDIVGRLLADGHAKLLEICQLVLDQCQAGGLALHHLLGGCVRGIEVGDGLAVQCTSCLVVHCHHAIVVLDGWRGWEYIRRPKVLKTSLLLLSSHAFHDGDRSTTG